MALNLLCMALTVLCMALTALDMALTALDMTLTVLYVLYSLDGGGHRRRGRWRPRLTRGAAPPPTLPPARGSGSPPWPPACRFQVLWVRAWDSAPPPTCWGSEFGVGSRALADMAGSEGIGKSTMANSLPGFGVRVWSSEFGVQGLTRGVQADDSASEGTGSPSWPPVCNEQGS